MGSSQIRWQTVFEALPHPAFVLDMDHRIIAANKAALSKIGLAQGQIVGEPCWRICHGTETPPEGCPLETLRSSGTSEIVQMEVQAFGGTYLVSCMPIGDAGTEGGIVLHVAADITPLKHAQKALQASAQRYRSLVETMPNGVLELDEQGQVVFANPAAEAMLGYAPGSLVGTRIWWLEKDSPGQLEGLVRSMVHQRPEPTIYRGTWVKRSGGLVVVQVDWAYRFNLDGVLTGLVAVVTDITAQYQAEERLRREQALLQSIYLAVPVGVGLVYNRILKDHNERLSQMIGYQREELIGRDSRFLYLTDEEYERVGRNYENIRRLGIGTIETQWRCKDGRVIDVLLNYASLNPDDLSQGVIFTALDITERKRHEREIARLNRLYATLSNVNQAIIRIRDPQALFEAICKIAVEQGRFRLAWIGLLDERTKMVRPVAWAGHEAGYLKDIRVTAEDEPEGRGPVGTAIRSGRLSVCQDVERDPMMAPWREAALERGYRAVAAVPIVVLGQVKGAFAIYAPEPGFFSEHEQQLLIEMGQDISFALQAAQIEQQRAQMQSALELSEQRLQLATMGANDGIWDWPDLGQDGHWWSPVFFRLLGYEHGQIEPSYVAFCELVHKKDIGQFKAAVADLIERDRPMDVECRLRTRSGRYRWFRIRAGAVRDKDGKAVRLAGSIRDVTEVHKAHARLAVNQKRLNSLATKLSLAEEQERRRIAVGVHDDIGQRLALAKLQLQTLLQSSAASQVAGVVDQVCELIDQTMQQARSLAFELSNPVLYEVGLEAAVESWLTRQIEQRTGIKCHFSSEISDIKLDQELAVVLFQAIRELLTNVVKHAKAKNIHVLMTRSQGKVVVTITDDGVGFDWRSVASGAGRRGLGLFNVKERLESVRGQLEIDSAPGKGTKACISVPLRVARHV